MPRPDPIRLREAEASRPLHEAKVIDAEFRVVDRAPRALRMIWRALLAVFLAALIGFLIPPAWILLEDLGAYLARR